jgi:hypothetical protein
MNLKLWRISFERKELEERRTLKEQELALQM